MANPEVGIHTHLQPDGVVASKYDHFPQDGPGLMFQRLRLTLGALEVEVFHMTPDAVETLADNMKLQAHKVRREMAVEVAAQVTAEITAGQEAALSAVRLAREAELENYRAAGLTVEEGDALVDVEMAARAEADTQTEEV